MKKILFILLILVAFGALAFVYLNHLEEVQAVEVSFEYIHELELPCDTGIIKHNAYSFSYNEKHELANWVAYELTAIELDGSVKRINRFKEDTFVETGTATNKDYKRSGYDRGHLAPAADMAFSKQVMLESFYYSNMSPQDPGFNRGIWKELEEQVREWAIEDSAIYINTGPILRDSLPTIGDNHVSIPEYFYKAILCYRKGKQTAIGFIMPNEKSDGSIWDFVVPIDEIEQRTGLDLFCKLPDSIENELEIKLDTIVWK